jgi:hypothetical protein
MRNRKMMKKTITKKICKKKKTSTLPLPFPYKPSPQNKKQK